MLFLFLRRSESQTALDEFIQGGLNIWTTLSRRLTALFSGKIRVAFKILYEKIQRSGFGNVAKTAPLTNPLSNF